MASPDAGMSGGSAAGLDVRLEDLSPDGLRDFYDKMVSYVTNVEMRNGGNEMAAGPLARAMQRQACARTHTTGGALLAKLVPQVLESMEKAATDSAAAAAAESGGRPKVAKIMAYEFTGELRDTLTAELQGEWRKQTVKQFMDECQGVMDTPSIYLGRKLAAWKDQTAARAAYTGEQCTQLLVAGLHESIRASVLDSFKRSPEWTEDPEAALPVLAKLAEQAWKTRDWGSAGGAAAAPRAHVTMPAGVPPGAATQASSEQALERLAAVVSRLDSRLDSKLDSISSRLDAVEGRPGGPGGAGAKPPAKVFPLGTPDVDFCGHCGDKRHRSDGCFDKWPHLREAWAQQRARQQQGRPAGPTDRRGPYTAVTSMQQEGGMPADWREHKPDPEASPAQRSLVQCMHYAASAGGPAPAWAYQDLREGNHLLPSHGVTEPSYGPTCRVARVGPVLCSTAVVESAAAESRFPYGALVESQGHVGRVGNSWGGMAALHCADGEVRQAEWGSCRGYEGALEPIQQRAIDTLLQHQTNIFTGVDYAAAYKLPCLPYAAQC